MKSSKILKNKMVVILHLSIFFLKANANTVGYNPDDVKKLENSYPPTCMQCNLDGWKMYNSTVFMYGLNYSQTNLSGTILDNSNIFNELQGRASLTNVARSDFSYSIAQNANIGDSVTMDFSSSNFNGVKYNNTVISAKSFKNSTFREAVITNSGIRMNSGDSADFTGADLNNSSIGPGVGQCSLQSAIFVNANLTNTTTSSCDESNSDFTGADLTGASIVNGNLCNAKITPEQIASMQSLSGTIGPDCKTVYK